MTENSEFIPINHFDGKTSIIPKSTNRSLSKRFVQLKQLGATAYHKNPSMVNGQTKVYKNDNCPPKENGRNQADPAIQPENKLGNVHKHNVKRLDSRRLYDLWHRKESQNEKSYTKHLYNGSRDDYHRTTITKEQLDRELDEYMSHVRKGKTSKSIRLTSEISKANNDDKLKNDKIIKEGNSKSSNEMKEYWDDFLSLDDSEEMDTSV